MPVTGGAPKVQVPVSNAFGQQTVRQISLDTNRPEIQAESLWRFGNMVAIPSRGLYTDGLMWVLAVAVPIRVLNSLVLSFVVPEIAAMLIMALLVGPIACALYQVWSMLPEYRPACAYRMALLLCGFLLAKVTLGG